ncbi:MAG: cyclase family protein [Bacteroidia bacterium]
MEIRFSIHNHNFRTVGEPHDISIPLNFGGPQPSSYGVPPATSVPYRDGQWIGDVNQGGSCNFEEVRITAHCNGTHTESVGHLAAEAVPVHRILTDSLLPATLVTVIPQTAEESGERYEPNPGETDMLITGQRLKMLLENADPVFLKALVIRSLPNPEEKQFWQYGEDRLPPYFSHEAMEYIHALGVEHLLVDLPSIDRLFDEGKLSNHRIFWQLEKEGHLVDLGNTITRRRTITEFIYVPDHLADGHYLLNLQIAAFMADASPSRPQLYPVSNTE